jgi:hypothetical protein
MTRGILIAGNETPLYAATAAAAAKRVESFVSVLIPNRLPLPEGPLPRVETTGGAIPLLWNPASPISARTMLLAAGNRLGQINDAILICSPPAVFKTPEALTPEEIEITVNDHIKGWFFLIRELVLYFRRSGAGSLSFVAPETTPGKGKNVPVDLLGVPAAASFHSFAQGNIALAANEPFSIMGFTGSEAGAEEEFAAWLFKIIDEGARKNTGRWNKYSRRGFFR